MLTAGDRLRTAVLILSDLNHVSGDKEPGSPLPAAEKLRAQAARYRSLAETLFDASLLAVVQQCARELDAEAEILEQTKSGGGSAAC
jgi:hypothetical protein